MARKKRNQKKWFMLELDEVKLPIVTVLQKGLYTYNSISFLMKFNIAGVPSTSVEVFELSFFK